MENDDTFVEQQAKIAYTVYWATLGKGKGTNWWALHETHRERWRDVVRAVRKVKRRKLVSV